MLFNLQDDYSKFFVRILALCLSVLLIVIILNSIVYKIVDPRLKTPYFVFNSKFNVYKDSKVEYDTLFFGSSRIFMHVRPDTFDYFTGFKSFNFGVSACVPSKSNYLLEKILETSQASKLKRIFIELMPYFPTDHEINTEEHYFLTDPFLDLEGLLQFSDEFSKDEFLHFLFSGFKTIFYKYTRAIRLLFYNYKTTKSESYEMQSGYESIELSTKNVAIWNKTAECKRNNYTLDKKCDLKTFLTEDLLENEVRLLRESRGKDIRSYKFNPRAILQEEPRDTSYIKKYQEQIDLIKSKKIQIYFIIPPGVDSPLIYSQLTKLIQDNKDIPVFDFSSPVLFPDLYKTKNLFDEKHLNNTGAEIFSILLGKSMHLVDGV